MVGGSGEAIVVSDFGHVVITVVVGRDSKDEAQN